MPCYLPLVSCLGRFDVQSSCLKKGPTRLPAGPACGLDLCGCKFYRFPHSRERQGQPGRQTARVGLPDGCRHGGGHLGNAFRGHARLQDRPACRLRSRAYLGVLVDCHFRHGGRLLYRGPGKKPLAARDRRGGDRLGYRHHALHRHEGLSHDWHGQPGFRGGACLDRARRGVQRRRATQLSTSLTHPTVRGHQPADHCDLQLALHGNGRGDHNARSNDDRLPRPSWTTPRWRLP